MWRKGKRREDFCDVFSFDVQEMVSNTENKSKVRGRAGGGVGSGGGGEQEEVEG